MVYSKGCHSVFYHRYHIVWATRYRYQVLRPGNVHSADGRRAVLEPVVVRYRGRQLRRYFRADAAFAAPEVGDSRF